MQKQEINSKSPVILLADDRRATRLMIRNTLQEEGYYVVEAENGDEVLEIFMIKNPSVVMMDISMPVMDGITACHKLKKLPDGEKVPVLMFTSVDDPISMEQAFEAGAADFITKPFNWQELKHRVKRLLYLREKEDTIQRQAYYDRLTGLPNRLLLLDRLSVALKEASKNNKMVAVLYLNIRNFKLINDAFGYDNADILLTQVADKLKLTLDNNTTLARVGGDDFALFISGLEKSEDVGRVAEQLISAFEGSWHVAQQEVDINCNIGIALYPEDASDAKALLSNAEIAMFRSVERFNIYKYYNTKMHTRAVERLTLENNMRRGIEGGEFFLVYQPLIDINTGKISGAEALMRWQHPERGLISPGEFIPLAEKTGMIVRMGEKALHSACTQNKAWQDKGFKPFVVSVNISSLQFQNPELLETIDKILLQTSLDPKWLKLELTESLAMQDINHTISMLTEFKKRGIKIAVDDFGTGYSSLQYLKRLPLDELKIDRSFVGDVVVDQDDAVIVKTMIVLGKSLNLNTVAEGVETKEQLEFLKNNQCDLAQGYFFARPAPAQEFTDYLYEESSKY